MTPFTQPTILCGKTIMILLPPQVVEHLRAPGPALNRLWDHLNPGGTLGLMTQLVIPSQDFASWYYQKDPTHISFYSEATFQWLAGSWKAEIEILGMDVILLKKKG